MAITRGSFTTHTYDGVNTFNIGKPSGLAVGDYLLLIGAIPQPTTGWTHLWSQAEATESWYKVADASDVAAAAYTCTTAQYSAILVYYRGVLPGSTVEKYKAAGGPDTFPPVTVTEYGAMVIRWRLQLNTAGFVSFTLPTGGWTEVTRTAYYDGAFYQNQQLIDRVPVPKGTNTGTWPNSSPNSICIGNMAFMLIPPQLTGSIVSVGSSLSATNLLKTGELGGFITSGSIVEGEFSAQNALAGTIQAGGSSLEGELAGTHFKDFTVFDSYVDDGTDFYGLIYEESDEYKKGTQTMDLRPQRTDVGNNPLEQRPEFGDYFAQGDFSGGGNQPFFHAPGRDVAKYLRSEGFDISKPGVLRHLNETASTLASDTVGKMAIAGGLPFVTNGDVISVGSGDLPGSWSDEDPHDGEGAADIAWVTGEGDRLFAACGVNGVHVRDAGGSWSHYEVSGDPLDVGDVANIVEWLKDRLIVVGGTNSRQIFEVVADATPTPMETLAEGWSFQSIFEAGAFIFAVATNFITGQSRVHAYGLDDTASFLEKKTSTAFPRGEILLVGKGYIGSMLIAGGRLTPEFGMDPVVYQAEADQDGNLNFALLHAGTGAGANTYPVYCMETLPDSIVFGWTLPSTDPGGPRTGLAVRHLGRGAFSHGLSTSLLSSSLVNDVLLYHGKLLISVEGVGVFYETDVPVAEATLTSSVANWNSSGLKVWDLFQVEHNPLPEGGSVKVEYVTQDPDVDPDWSQSLNSSVPDSSGSKSFVSRLVSRLLAIRIRSVKGDTAPEVRSFSVRSNPVPEEPEYQLVRYARVFKRDRKDIRGEWQYVSPEEQSTALQELANTWITFYEPGVTWTAFVRSVFVIESVLPIAVDTRGGVDREGFIVQLQMVATRGAA